MGALRIYLNTPTASRKGLRYDVRLSRADGDLIVTGSIQPLTDAARYLYEKGARGRLEAWDSVRPYPRMWGQIQRLAKVVALDPDRGNLTFARWRPHPHAREEQKSAFEPLDVPKPPQRADTPLLAFPMPLEAA